MPSLGPLALLMSRDKKIAAQVDDDWYTMIVRLEREKIATSFSYDDGTKRCTLDAAAIVAAVRSIAGRFELSRSAFAWYRPRKHGRLAPPAMLHAIAEALAPEDLALVQLITKLADQIVIALVPASDRDAVIAEARRVRKRIVAL